MSSAFVRFNDGSNNPPRLRVQHSLWALLRLPMNSDVEWTLDEKFSRVREAGFEAVECFIGDDEEAEVGAALQRHSLRVVLGHRPFTVADTQAVIERAARMGADFVFAQPASAFTPLANVVEVITQGRALAAEKGMPYFVEVHRNNFTENLPQTKQLIEALPDIRFTADLSHFVLAGEFYGWADENAAGHMAPVLERTSHAHGRISDGEAAQVDVGDGSGDTAQFFVQLWTIAMRNWLQGAGPGDIFPLTSELGPPRYALTLPDGREFSDRWEQSLVIKKLAEQAWRQAQEPAVG